MTNWDVHLDRRAGGRIGAGLNQPPWVILMAKSDYLPTNLHHTYYIFMYIQSNWHSCFYQITYVLSIPLISIFPSILALSIVLSTYLFYLSTVPICVSICLSMCLSACLSACLPVCLPVGLFLCLSGYLFVYLSVYSYLFIDLSIWSHHLHLLLFICTLYSNLLSHCLSTYLCMCTVYVSVYLLI